MLFQFYQQHRQKLALYHLESSCPCIWMVQTSSQGIWMLRHVSQMYSVWSIYLRFAILGSTEHLGKYVIHIHPLSVCVYVFQYIYIYRPRPFNFTLQSTCMPQAQKGRLGKGRYKHKPIHRDCAMYFPIYCLLKSRNDYFVSVCYQACAAGELQELFGLLRCSHYKHGVLVWWHQSFQVPKMEKSSPI